MNCPTGNWSFLFTQTVYIDGLSKFGSELELKKIFSDVSVLVFVIDASTSLQGTKEANFGLLEAAIGPLWKYSPDAKLVIFLHKTDLISIPSAETATGNSGSSVYLKELESEIKKIALPTFSNVYPTSIWDESLCKVF